MSDHEKNQDTNQSTERTTGHSEQTNNPDTSETDMHTLKQELRSEILEELRQQTTSPPRAASRFGRFFSGYKLSIVIGIVALVFGFWAGTIFDHHPNKGGNNRDEVRKMVQHHFNDNGHGHRGEGRFR